MGKIHSTKDPSTLFHRWRIPFTINELKCTFSLEFQINIHQREIFTRDTILSFHEGPIQHHLELQFHYPTGKFDQATLKIQDLHTSKISYGFDLREDFPLIWPSCAHPPQNSQSPDSILAGTTPEKPKEPPLKEILQDKSHPDQAQQPDSVPFRTQAQQMEPAKPRQGLDGLEENHAPVVPDARYRLPQSPLKPPAAQAPAKPAGRPSVSRTEQMSTRQLLAALSTEHNPDLRWKIIEANLMLGHPERTYPLILHYADLIAERAKQWPRFGLKLLLFINQGASWSTSCMTGM